MHHHINVKRILNYTGVTGKRKAGHSFLHNKPCQMFLIIL